MERSMRRTPLQWHPAFFAGLQIELDAESENLIFENEHQLGTKPKEIDVLVIKKDTQKPISKNIGRIFRKHNIIEYKSPEDYLSIDDFYKVYGYACFYKADVESVDAIKIEEMTISFMCYKNPRKLVKHLNTHGHPVRYADKGIYYIEDFDIPIQLILTSALPKEENLWLRSLTNRLQKENILNNILREYEEHKLDSRYDSLIDIIIHANQSFFEKEDKRMCEALEKIIEERMKPRMEELDKREEDIDKREEVIDRREEALDEKEAAFEKQWEEITQQSTERVNHLIRLLLQTSRNDDIEKAVTDIEYQNKLFLEFGI